MESTKFRRIIDQIGGNISHHQKDLIVELVERKNERGGEPELREREAESKSERERKYE